MTRPIRWEIIEQNYDQLVKYATAIRVGTASTEAILRRFTRNASHPVYQAMLELGRAQKTIFIARYLRDRDLQCEINEGLNLIESWNRVNDVIFFGKSGEFAIHADPGAEGRPDWVLLAASSSRWRAVLRRCSSTRRCARPSVRRSSLSNWSSSSSPRSMTSACSKTSMSGWRRAGSRRRSCCAVIRRPSTSSARRRAGGRALMSMSEAPSATSRR